MVATYLMIYVLALRTYFSAIPPVIEAALQGGSRLVQSTLHDCLKTLFSQLYGRLSREDGKLLGLGELELPVTALANRLLFHDDQLATETIRSKRAQAAEQYIIVCRQAGFALDGHVQRSITAWLTQERSEPTQRILNQALQKLEADR
jgi:hypothetical protein